MSAESRAMGLMTFDTQIKSHFKLYDDFIENSNVLIQRLNAREKKHKSFEEMPITNGNAYYSVASDHLLCLDPSKTGNWMSQMTNTSL